MGFKKKKKKMEEVDSDVVESKDEDASAKEQEEQVEVGYNELPAFLYAVAVHTQNTAALLVETNKKLDELIKKVE